MKIVTIVGARPQFIKAAVVSASLKRVPALHEVIIHTGQHYDTEMSGVFFQELGISDPTYHLNIGSGNHGDQTGRMLAGVEQVLLKEKPDVVLVYGDTNSTLAGALAAVKLHIPVAHVESGLRSFNRQMPEEINRVATDHMAELLFAPTETAVENLKQEGIEGARVRRVGDVLYDATLFFSGKALETSQVLGRLKLEPRRYILATVHRAENTDSPERLSALIEGFSIAAREYPVVLPLHPRTRKLCELAGIFKGKSRRLLLTEPLGYLDMIRLESAAAVIATDSGGVQKEAFFHRVPCVTLREETEWVELVEMGWNRLAPPRSAEGVAEAITSAIQTSGVEGSPYGNGASSDAIARGLRDSFELQEEF